MVEGRLVARKMRLADVIAGNLIEEAPRVNIIGVVVSVNAQEPPSFVMDDGSALVLVRQFDGRMSPAIGAAACIIGRVREYGGQRYIASEIVRTLDARWLAVRSLELAKESSFITPSLPSAEERVSDDDAHAPLLEAIRSRDNGAGASIDELVTTRPDAERTIATLLKRGNVFEVSPGRIKILE